jgi:Methyltransferase domain/Glycosyl transferases group 1
MSRTGAIPSLSIAGAPDETAAQILRFCLSPASFRIPERIGPQPSWLEHAPFAFWLVDALGPGILVELGTHGGFSYFALCEAVQRCRLEARCYAVDTWSGDEHAGYYGEDVYLGVKRHNDQRYAAFSTLVRSTFDAAVEHFSDGSIDLLHIDGRHFYDDVKHDFETWQRKLSDRAVVLFHDINVREKGFGVFRLWEDLRETSPHFEFFHGHGLGVLGVGSALPSPLKTLFAATGDAQASSSIRDAYSRLGSAVSLGWKTRELEVELRRLTTEAAQAQASREESLGEIAALRANADKLRDDVATQTGQANAAREDLVAEAAKRQLLEQELAAAARERQLLEQELASEAAKRQLLEQELASEAAKRQLLEQEFASEGAKRQLFAAEAAKRQSLEQDLAGEAAKRESVERELALRSTQAAEMAEAVVAAETRARTLEDRLASESRALANLSGELTSAREQIVTINDRVANLQIELAQNHARAERLEESLAAHQSRLAQSEAAGEASELELETIRRSTSWRLTGPLRVIARRNPWLARRGQQALKLIWWTVTLQIAARLRARRAAAEHAAGSSEAPGDLRAEQPATQPQLTFELQPSGAAAPVNRPSQRPCILYVTHVRPYPPRAGNEYRIHRMLSWLTQQDWDIVLLITPLPNEHFPEDETEELSRAYRNVVVVRHDGKIWHRLARRDAADAVVSLSKAKVQDFALPLAEYDRPLPTRVAHLTRSFCPDTVVQAALALEAAIAPKIVLVSYIFMTRLFPVLRTDPLKVIDTHDVFSTKNAKLRQFGVSDGLELSRSEEAELLNRGHVAIAIQPHEAEELRQIAPSVRIVTAGVDYPCTAHQDNEETPAVRSFIVLIVASGNLLNEKGVRDFLRFAWPLVRRAVPEAKLHVVGSICDNLRSNSAAGVYALGRVEDLSAHYAQACVVINPTAVGTGLKIKTLEALSRYRPIVVWPSGVDGLGPELRSLCLVATDWFEFAQAVIAILSRDEPVAYSVAQRETIVRLLSPDLVYAELGQVFSQTLIRHSQAAE